MTADPAGRAMGLLGATGPHPSYCSELALYGQFVGAWEVANRYYVEREGVWRENTREWAFGWVLEGRGVQDVLRDHADSPGAGIGTTIRVYDHTLGAWRVNWFGAAVGEYCSLIGRASHHEIQQEGVQGDGRRIRWTFSDITPASFRWLGHISDDDGASWRLEQEMCARR